MLNKFALASRQPFSLQRSSSAFKPCLPMQASVLQRPLTARPMSGTNGYLGLKHKTKFTNNMKINELFKSSTTDGFIYRHIGNDKEQTRDILDTLGVENIGELMDQTVPDTIRLSEQEMFRHNGKQVDNFNSQDLVTRQMKKVASVNKDYRTYIGQGYYKAILPAVIQRNVLENPKWYTPYTPYQAEIAQGRLEMLLNYQTMITEITDMDISNASLLDESTAVAEAMAMSFSTHNQKRKKFFISKSMWAQTIGVCQTRADGLGIELIIDDLENFPMDQASEFCGVVCQNPDRLGNVKDFSEFFALLQKSKVRCTVASDLMGNCILKPPGQMGADIAVGTVQRFGLPVAFGGPHPGYLACKDEFKRKMPGRVIGVSIDADGNSALRTAMQVREQHIRRDKATSNVCTAQALLANMTALYGIWHRAEGLTTIAKRLKFRTQVLMKELDTLGYKIVTDRANYFDTVCIDCKASGFSNAEYMLEEFQEYEINLGQIDENIVNVSMNESTTIQDLTDLIEIFAALKDKSQELGSYIGQDYYQDLVFDEYPQEIKRRGKFLQQQVFTQLTSETEFMRYITRLGDMDVGLSNGMVPLGSCTMKLNSAFAMNTITLDGFANIHPFAPRNQTGGYNFMIWELENYLSAITHYDVVSLQPNSGANGELAGLLAIKKYHQSRNDDKRKICLVPTSAHGTNPATAVMVGYKVLPIKCDNKGNIEVEDMRQQIKGKEDQIAALMLTYPSTHGVFEDAGKDICDLMHDIGAQVYMDGANMNAQLGLTAPGKIGADVGHLNLHKTFSIPHGGGGPGIGCIGAGKHLEPFLPGHVVKPINGRTEGAVNGAPYGNAGVLSIPYSYIKMCSEKGLLKCGQQAILNANYMAQELERFGYKILYKGVCGRVAHEFIVDVSGYKKTIGITEEDVAKRLMDYGFHAPTMSWPHVGGLMIEPTESEDKLEMDRFNDAMRKIMLEIKEIEEGKADLKNNVLKNAPHTLKRLMSSDWDTKFPYSREKAAYPAKWVHQRGKIFPMAARIDSAYGDRNLVCTCPPVSDYFTDEEDEDKSLLR